LVVALVGAEVAYMLDFGAVTSLLFFIVMFGVHILVMRSAFEWANVLMFAAVGVELGFVAAGSVMNNAEISSSLLMSNGETIGVLDAYRAIIGFQFFSYVMLFTILGILVAVLARGVLSPSSADGWFSHITDGNGAWNRSTLPLQIGLGVWALAHIASLWHFEYLVNDPQTMFNVFGPFSGPVVNAYPELANYHGYFGFWSAFLTGMVAMIVSAMVSERWFTRAMLLGSMWALYLVSAWYEAGLIQNEAFEGSWGALIWLAFTFFICAIIYVISTSDNWGGWSNISEYEPSGARRFWNAHWAGIMIGMAFFFGMVIRVQWYVIPSMNSLGTNTWDMTGGSDPWYMKRVVDYILANNAHLIVDADRSYPIGGINPRPPLFTWSIAILAGLLAPFVGNESAVWWAILSLPAVYGALTILPVAAIASEHVSKKAGVVAAWLIAFMPAHVSHTTFALADHDAFIMLFLTMGFMFWLKAIKYAGSDRLLRSTSPSITTFIQSFSAVANQRTAALSYAVLAGVSFGVVSLGWKGFVVGPSILFLAYALQVALNMFRRRDSTTLSVLFISMLAVNFLMALPFYGHPQLDLILDGTGLQPFLFIAIFTIAIAFVTTGFRDKPWLLVLGVLGGSGLAFFAVLYVLKTLEVSNAWDVLFTGGGYFTKTKIFGTVAEANAVSNRGQLFAQFGPITFLLSLVMGLLCLVSGLRERKHTNLVFGVWILAASYMAWTAARFMFNATPAIAVLGAWGIMSLWKWANWDGMVRAWKKFGIRTPEDRIRGARKALWRSPNFSAIFLVMIMLFGQQATYGLDAAIPQTVAAEEELDEKIFNLIPDALRFEIGGFSLLDDSPYDGNWYLGSMGSGFNDNSWNAAYDWLADQDTDEQYSERPAFVSWWDYGFQALSQGEHPSVSDNFQSGIPATGNMLLAQSQEDLVSMFIWQLAQGDIAYNNANDGEYAFTSGFADRVEAHFTAE
jgi:asparagine N-glycosylation enzyme membrane subunit Stt3